MNILICDDEKETVDFLKKFLVRRGCNILTAYDQEKAVKVFKENAVDLVFLDILIPGGDGFAVLEELRALKPGIAVVMMTGCAIDERKAKELAVFDYLYKPFDLDRIGWIIERVKKLQGR